jgi:hypothetical protein
MMALAAGRLLKAECAKEVHDVNIMGDTKVYIVT